MCICKAHKSFYCHKLKTGANVDAFFKKTIRMSVFSFNSFLFSFVTYKLKVILNEQQKMKLKCKNYIHDGNFFWAATSMSSYIEK